MHTSTVKTDLAFAGGKFNNAQLEVLKIFDHSISEGQLSSFNVPLGMRMVPPFWEMVAPVLATNSATK